MKNKFALALAAGLLALVSPSSAQLFSIDRSVIAGGGGTSTGGGFAISATLGQHGAGAQPLTGGGFSLAGGFWSLVAVQMPDAPLLSVERLGTAVRVFWPLPATGFVLEQSSTAAGEWSQVALPYVTNSTDISISAPAPAGNRFYRLRKP